ncbi:MAG: response regulator [Armatimonadota bacterium]
MRSDRPITILLIEDSATDVQITRRALRRWSVPCSLYVARDGEEGLEFLHRRGRYEGAPRPNIILLDLNLPKLSGHDVLKQIKADEELRRIPVVMFTASQDEADISTSYDLGVNAYMCKSEDPDTAQTRLGALEEYWLSAAQLPQS